MCTILNVFKVYSEIKTSLKDWLLFEDHITVRKIKEQKQYLLDSNLTHLYTKLYLEVSSCCFKDLFSGCLSIVRDIDFI